MALHRDWSAGEVMQRLKVGVGVGGAEAGAEEMGLGMLMVRPTMTGGAYVGEGYGGRFSRGSAASPSASWCLCL
jgi:hypothetical protein